MGIPHGSSGLWAGYLNCKIDTWLVGAMSFHLLREPLLPCNGGKDIPSMSKFCLDNQCSYKCFHSKMVQADPPGSCRLLVTDYGCTNTYIKICNAHSCTVHKTDLNLFCSKQAYVRWHCVKELNFMVLTCQFTNF